MSNSTKAQTVEEVEDKFGRYWPRNILILFGPPGLSLFFASIPSIFFLERLLPGHSFSFFPSNSFSFCSFRKGNAWAQD